MLSTHEKIDVCSHHGQLKSAIPSIVENKPDVVVIDYSFSNTIEAIHATQAVHGETAIVISGIKVDEETIIPCAKAGAASYIQLDATSEQWAETIIDATDGKISDGTIGGLLNSYLGRPGTNHPKQTASEATGSWAVSKKIEDSARRAGLTPRERQVLSLVDRGLSTKSIARELNCSPSTVKAHVQAVLGKYNVHRRSEAAAIFREGVEPGQRASGPRPHRNN